MSSTSTLYRRQIQRRYKLSQWTIRQARKTGFIGPIRGPAFVRKGSRYLATQHEMDVYLARLKQFQRTFLNGAMMTKVIGSNYGGVPYERNADAKSIVKMRSYFDVMPPMYYTFIGGQRRKYWHVEDVLLFKRFIDGVLNRNLPRDISHPCYSPEEDIWRPMYSSPADFSERYTDETRLRIFGEDAQDELEESAEEYEDDYDDEDEDDEDAY